MHICLEQVEADHIPLYAEHFANISIGISMEKQWGQHMGSDRVYDVYDRKRDKGR